MGCDIHVNTEKFVNGKWININKGVKKLPSEFNENPLEYRSYKTFRFLADVRNYTLEDWGDKSKRYEKPILDENRGIPEDCSEETFNDWRSWEGDGHSPTWYLLSELIEWNKDKNDGNFNEIISFYNQLHIQPELLRLVIFFDN